MKPSFSRRVPPDDVVPRRVCDHCGFVDYVNPRIVVGTVCARDGRVLLCRRAIEPRPGFWTIPAGYLELGESTEAGARREAYEEARARIEIEGLLAVYNVVRIAQVQVLYRAKLLADDVAAGPETEEVALFGWRDIPWGELAFPTVHWVLARALELRGREGPFETVGNPMGADPPPLAAT